MSAGSFFTNSGCQELVPPGIDDWPEEEGCRNPDDDPGPKVDGNTGGKSTMPSTSPLDDGSADG